MLRNTSAGSRWGVVARCHAAVERLGPTALGDLALDRAPEQVEDLRHDDHARDPVVPQASKMTRGFRLRT
jgi:hypothetical protein